MSGVNARFSLVGPITHKVGEVVKGGQIVGARDNLAAGLVGVAEAGSLRALGVATKDAAPAATNDNRVTDQFGNVTVDASNVVTAYVAVADGHYPVVYSTAAKHGESLVVGTNGSVAVPAAAPDPRAIIGTCSEPAGVTAGAVGLAKISR